MSFSGFNTGIEVIPTQFFEEILPEIDSMTELKVSLFAIHLLNQFEGDQRYILYSDFTDAAEFMEGLAGIEEDREDALKDGLEKAVLRGTLLKVEYGGESLYFLNSPKGRTAVENLENGKWKPDAFLHLSGTLNLFRPNIFQLYEENIGPLTPLMADRLKDAEQMYSEEWITEAIDIAVVNNARSWRYIETILKSWKENGRNGIY